MYKYMFKTTKSWSKYQKAVENKLLKLLTRVGGVMEIRVVLWHTKGSSGGVEVQDTSEPNPLALPEDPRSALRTGPWSPGSAPFDLSSIRHPSVSRVTVSPGNSRGKHTPVTSKGGPGQDVEAGLECLGWTNGQTSAGLQQCFSLSHS